MNENFQTLGELLNGRREQIPFDKLSLSVEMQEDVHKLTDQLLIVAGPDDNGNYEILAGTQAYMAACFVSKENAAQNVSCFVIKNEDVDETVRQLCAEIDRLQYSSTTEIVDQKRGREVHRFRVMDLLCEFVKTRDMKHRTISSAFKKIFNVTDRMARSYLSVYENGISELRDAVIASMPRGKKKSSSTVGQVHLTVNGKLENFCKCVPQKEQYRALERINAGEKSSAVIEEYISKYTGK